MLCTIHRAENKDDPERLKNIFIGLEASGDTVILPMHPRTRAKLAASVKDMPGNVWSIDPVAYMEMVWLEANSRLVVTDSGGAQKETYFHGKICITLREETEWMELIGSGWDTLAGANPYLIAEMIATEKGPKESPFYGNGDAVVRIAKGV